MKIICSTVAYIMSCHIISDQPFFSIFITDKSIKWVYRDAVVFLVVVVLVVIILNSRMIVVVVVVQYSTHV